MRAAAAEQAKQTKGSGRGMMGVILPMYAVGIVVYLVYTLFKVRFLYVILKDIQHLYIVKIDKAYIFHTSLRLPLRLRHSITY